MKPATVNFATEVTHNWDRPGAGTWMLDTSHFDPDASRIARDALEVGSVAGFERGFTRFGAPVRSLAMRFVNGRLYTTLLPVFGGGRDLPEPPLPILKAVLRFHPEFRRRNRTAQHAIEGRIALEDHARWEASLKPELVAKNAAFTAVETTALSDQQLGDHIQQLYAHLVESLALHMELHVSDLGPIGLMLLRGQELGLDAVDLMQTLTGSSPATVGPSASMEELRTMIAAAPTVPTTLDEVRETSVEAAEALDGWMSVYGDRLTMGYDLQDQTLRELPHIVLASLLASGPDRVGAEARTVGDGHAADLLAPLGAADRDEMQTMIEDARALYGLRDENGPLTWQWPMGVMRRAVLDAQTRLMAAGKLSDPRGVFDLTAQEMAGLLGSGKAPGLAEIEARTRNREAWGTMEPPEHLGPDPVDPPLDALPPALRRLMEAIGLVQGLLEGEDSRLAPAAVVQLADAPTALTGIGIGDQTYAGRARVVADADEGLTRVAAGDVLVTPFTVPTFNAVLAIAGAVVVEHGGVLCHAAVIAREFGIPGVVGAASATTEIPDGAMVEVNAATGTVTVLAE